MKVPFPGLTSVAVAALCACAASPQQEGTPGFIIIGPEVETFEPCSGSEPLWLDADRETLAALKDRYYELRQTPYERTFAVLVGTKGPQLDCGFCEAYEGSFRVDRVIQHRRAQDGDCDQVEPNPPNRR